MKIAGSYSSLLRGVSQQPPEVRMAGQHAEQVNMLPDPVNGLVRRRGTVLQDCRIVPVSGAAYTPATVEATGTGYRKITHKDNGQDYVILLRETPQGGGFVGESMPPIMCYNESAKQFTEVNWNFGSSEQELIRAVGIGAAVSVGRYLIFAPKNQPITTITEPRWNQFGYTRGVVWIRGGAYSRTYTIIVNGSTFSYTTPASTVAGSEALIQPANIAGQLAAMLNTAGFVGVQNNGSHLCFDFPGAGDVSTSDGGDGGLMRSAGRTVNSVDDLPIMSVKDHIVKVQPASDSWFYMQATAKASSSGALQQVIWRECAGEVQGTTMYGLGLGRIIGGVLYVGITGAANPSGLIHAEADGTPIPTLVQSFAGDTTLNPPPRFLSGGKPINYLGVFQDRLLVGSGAALAVSAAGDYLNFFRSTMTTVPVSDGFEMVPQGGEDDVLRHSVTYNKNLVIFGDKRQYVIPGTTPLVPTSPNMTIMTVYSQAAECPPVAAGGQIYYARNQEGWANIHQIQPGQYVDSAESFPASAQVRQYIPAPAVEIEAVPGTPTMLAVRSTNAPHAVYLFSYVDLPDGRKQDAWFRLEFDPACGHLMGMHATQEGLLLFWARADLVGLTWRVADLLQWSSVGNNKPYLDSMRAWPTIGSWPGANGATQFEPSNPFVMAFDNSPASGSRFLLGAPFRAGNVEYDAMLTLPEASGSMDNVWVGLPYDAYVELTNPYPTDSQGKAITTGRTTVGKLVVNTKDSGGIGWEVTAAGTTQPGSFTARSVGSLQVGKVAVSSSLVSVPIGRETRDYSIRLMARLWYPLKITSIEWVGQSFNRTPRAQGG